MSQDIQKRIQEHISHIKLGPRHPKWLKETADKEVPEGDNSNLNSAKKNLRRKINDGLEDGGHNNKDELNKQVQNGEGVKDDEDDIVTVMFDTDKWTKAKSMAWLKSKKMKPIKEAEEKNEFIHYRLKESDKDKKHKIKNFGKGIKVVIEI